MCGSNVVLHQYVRTDVRVRGPDFADASNFTTMAKHWGEMKGFGLALQFSPASPFGMEVLKV